MASSKVVTTNPDLPRDFSSSSSSSLSTFLSDLQHHHPMDDLFNSIYTSTTAPSSSSSSSKDMPSRTVDDVWKEIVAGSQSHSHSHSQGAATPTACAGEGLEEMTLEDFLTKAGAVREEDVRGVPTNNPIIAQFAVEEAFTNGIDGTVVGVAAAGGGGKGKRRAVEEPVDKATLQKQRRMIKNRESAARSRERKQAYTVELEYVVQQLEQENARLLSEEADKEKQRFKQLMECLIPIEEKRKPRPRLQRANSVQSM